MFDPTTPADKFSVDSAFLLAPDSFYKATGDLQDGDPNIECLDFNVTPLNGRDLQRASGALFNFQATFDNPGRWKLGFQQQQTVSRTYYQDNSQSPDCFWGDISNEHVGVANSVTVTYNPVLPTSAYANLGFHCASCKKSPGGCRGRSDIAAGTAQGPGEPESSLLSILSS
jgi:hypothetical protein